MVIINIFLQCYYHISLQFGQTNIDYCFTDDEWNEITTKSFYYSKRKRTEIFTKELEKVNKKLEVIGEYKASDIPIMVRCTNCGKKWEAIPNNLLRGSGCRYCAKKVRGDSHRKSSALKFEKRFKLKYPDIELGEYHGYKEKICLVCKKCGHLWESKPLYIDNRKKNLILFNKLHLSKGY